MARQVRVGAAGFSAYLPYLLDSVCIIHALLCVWLCVWTNLRLTAL
jgi:hypothetical protein